MDLTNALRKMVDAFDGSPALKHTKDGAYICLATAASKLLAILLPGVKLAPGGRWSPDDPGWRQAMLFEVGRQLEEQEGPLQPRGYVDPPQRSGPPACAVCRRTSGDVAVLRRCKGCGRLTGVRYCYQDCCREHWKHMGHRRQCEAAQKQLQQAFAPAEARASA